MQNDIPPTSLFNIFKRGMDGVSISLLIKVCKALGISLDALSEGRIERKTMDIHEVTKFDLELLTAYYEKEELQDAVNILLGISPKAPDLPTIDEK